MELHAAVAISGATNFGSTSNLRDGTSAVAVITTDHLTYQYSQHS